MKLWILLAALLVLSPALAAPGGSGTITPRYVDTSVINQTFVFTLGSINESVDSIVINSSADHVFTGVNDVTLNSSTCRVSSCSGDSVAFEPNRINVTFTTPVGAGTVISVTFTANTPSAQNVSNFAAYLINGNGQALVVPSGTGSLGVTTQQMISVTNVEMLKGTALLNGSDYWEFKFTVAYAASQAGHVQLRMNNWIDNNGYTIPLYSGSSYYATLRNESTFNTTGKFNVMTTYAGGINNTVTALYLRMLIPLGTLPSTTWSSSYNFLFRAAP